MIEGWNIKTDMSVQCANIAKDTMMSLDAEPHFAEIGEKVRELTGELHEKIMNQELQWSLMLTPLTMVEELKVMCESEISRRGIEIDEEVERRAKSCDNQLEMDI